MTRYMHGAKATEQERLERQGRMLGGASFLPPLREDMRLLEIGCGTGAIARQAAARTPRGELVGVDLEPAQIETARALATEAGLTNVSFRVGDATSLDFGEASFDGVYCRFLLEHLAAPATVLRQVRRLIRAGGWICAYEWENSCFTSYPICPSVELLWRAVCRLQDEIGGHGYAGRQLLRFFHEAGFERVRLAAHAWTFDATDREQLRWYVESAREIIGQARADLLERRLVEPGLLEKAEAEYDALLGHPHACAIEVMCSAVGTA